MISVIVPYKDAGPWVGRCCESLHNNSGDFEFILVDDWNRDGSAETVARYMEIDNRFKWFMSHGHGVSAARNTGLDEATGDWITFLDADDEMLPNAYRIMTNAARTGASIIQFNHLRYYSAINKTACKYSNDAGMYELPTLPRMWFGVWNKLFRADFVKGIRFDESLQYGEDGLFVLECLAKDGAIHHAEMNDKTVKHRFENENSLSRRKTLSDVVKQLNAYEQFLLRQDDPELRIVVCLEMSSLWGKLAETINK